MSAPSPLELRKYIFDSFIEEARAPLIEEIMARFGLGREDASHLLLDLQAAHHILLLPGTHRILMANPFSNLPTPFRVTANSKVYYANCAWDAIALHLVLEVDARIHSYCHHCGTAIEFGLSGGKRSSDDGGNAVVYLGTPVSRWYENLLVTCSNTMVFFATNEHFTEWQRSNPGAGGVSLSVDTMIEVVAPISRGRARLEYQMPSRAQLMSQWDSIGLRGPFWTF